MYCSRHETWSKIHQLTYNNKLSGVSLYEIICTGVSLGLTQMEVHTKVYKSHRNKTKKIFLERSLRRLTLYHRLNQIWEFVNGQTTLFSCPTNYKLLINPHICVTVWRHRERCIMIRIHTKIKRSV